MVGDQERLRREGFHIAFHAERISSAAEASLTQIHEARINIMLNPAVAKSLTGEGAGQERAATSVPAIEVTKIYPGVGAKRKSAEIE